MRLYDSAGKLVSSAVVLQGSTLAYIDTRTLYNGSYWVELSSGDAKRTQTIIVAH